MYKYTHSARVHTFIQTNKCYGKNGLSCKVSKETQDMKNGKNKEILSGPVSMDTGTTGSHTGKIGRVCLFDGFINFLGLFLLMGVLVMVYSHVIPFAQRPTPSGAVC